MKQTTESRAARKEKIIQRLRKGLDRGTFTVQDIAAATVRGEDTVARWLAGLNGPPASIFGVLEAFIAGRNGKEQ